MEEHLEIGLVAEAFLSGERASAGDVVRIDTNGHCWDGACSLAGSLEEIGKGRCLIVRRGLFHPLGGLLAVLIPPLGFFGLRLKFRDVGFSDHGFLRLRYRSCSRLVAVEV